MKRILMLEDDITFSVMLRTWLGKRGFSVDCASTVAEAKRCMTDGAYDIVLSDLRLPDEDGIVLLAWMKGQGIDVPFVVMTSYAEVQSAVNSMKLGAFDFIAKPINPEELHNKIKEALAQKKTQQRRISQNQVATFADYMPGRSEASQKLHEYIRLVAPTAMSVLLSGEPGSGKGVVARQIHIESGRREGFVVVDCATLSQENAASELFGNEGKEGFFRQAAGGTLFLQGLENLPENVRALLTQTLRDGVVRPLDKEEFPMDVRLIASTSLDTAELSSLGELYHLVNEFSICVPSLRERKGDILLYADHFVNEANEEMGKDVVGFDKEAIAALLDYAWPGNMRELRNVIKRVVLLSKSPFVSVTLLPTEMLNSRFAAEEEEDGLALRDANSEKRKIMKALKDCNNNKSQAAAMLQIDRKTLYNKLRSLGIL